MDNLCFDCGMCCNGTLFDKVENRAYDGVTGDVIYIKDITLPCKHHIDMKCAIYEERPRRCRDYECKMLMAYERGHITKDTALRLIQDTKTGVVHKTDFYKGRNLEGYGL